MTQSTDPFALVVDDNVLVLMVACDILSEVGFRPLEATSGDEARVILDERDGAVTLLFTDVEMPGATNGFALARYAAERWPNIEIVVASGRSSPGKGDLPPQATFIAKPFSAELVAGHLKAKLPDEKKPKPLQQAK